jgi:predicted enzyme related to lactoylglutathione lyase
MGERTSYAPGTFSWAELATSDADAAKAFYTSVLGWEYEDSDVGDGQVYTMARRDGKNVGALFRSEQPPHWNCYVTVTSADEAAARAQELGATVMMEPFDVMDVGRMSVIGDPAGAALCLWEPRQSIGAQLVNTPGSMTWNELVTNDPDGAARFYGGLFGWEFEEIPESGGYRVIKNGDRVNGGLTSQESPGANWIPYFGHDDVERAIEEIPGLGGQVLTGPVRMPAGSIGVFADPQGAVFALWTGEYDD